VHPTAVPQQAYVDEQYARSFVRYCIHQMEAHETDEWLRYRGELVYDPHGPEPRYDRVM
jgi:hypothetical protein